MSIFKVIFDFGDHSHVAVLDFPNCETEQEVKDSLKGKASLHYGDVGVNLEKTIDIKAEKIK